ncbi:aminotransferase class III-fold pyridoxal phosphate-dependent enzyme [Kineosporia sp. R_H_3]|uniref:aminotransferase class III-fold pyridoxal phosphate-dependent enzyme n=1 Tax=Kineosporia sp. R_H_3 TaxID=1961848 RepID=UPI000B4C207C|nr:aminotransferase class III-fold pyridoxal phosphate-dependent enzyme [Kineosporia sp. R_H_3]
MDRVIGRVAARFGIEGQVRPLPGERTWNGLVEDGATGRRAVVKVHAPEDGDDVDLENAALEHLAGGPAAGLVPHVLRTPDGAAWVDVDVAPDGDGTATRIGRALSWSDGTTWADGAPSDGSARAAALRSLGRTVAVVDAALAPFEHPHLGRTHRWNLLTAADRLADAAAVTDPGLRAVVTGVLTRFAADTLPRLGSLPQQAVHNDANEGNVVLGPDGTVTALVDFGDLCRAPRVCGLGVALTYAMADTLSRNGSASRNTAGDPWRAVLPVVEGYHAQAPLSAAEVVLLQGLVKARLATSIVMAAVQHAADPGNAYLLVSQAAVRALLERLCRNGSGDDPLTTYRLREACGLEPVPHARAVRAHLAQLPTDALAPVLAAPLADLPRGPYDWSADAIDAARVGIGPYLEDRQVYTTDLFDTGETGPDGLPEKRSVHLGVDLFVPAGTPVHAPVDGVVVALADNAAPLDYGPVVILEHRTPATPEHPDGAPFFTLYGHLSRPSLPRLTPGQRVPAGAVVAEVGDRHENGGWAPHLHLQLLTDLLGLGVDVPGVAPRAELAVWESLSPDPNLVLADPRGLRGAAPRSAPEIARERSHHLSPALSLSYREPLHIVRGEGAHLYDTDGRGWLDLVNNVAHVGHCHPRVVAAAAEQQALLNTNTRYLHDAVTTYARRLAGTMPDPLSVVFLVNSGSEANDLALRLAYAHTGARDVVVLDHAYHGHLTSIIDISPYKFDAPGGLGKPERTHVVPMPDAYRGVHRDGDDAGVPAYLRDLDGLLDGIAEAGRRPAAFFAEAIPGTAGQVVLAEGFLAGAYERVRAAGGICVADEVQTGFGRVGTAWWAFEEHGVVPDVVTLGKPIGNGHPIGAVVTTPEVARSFLTGMEYFNTFGGNPVSARVGQAVLDVVVDERLRAHAARLGGRLLADLRAVGERHPLVGDVRGRGLFLGVELVTDRQARTPAGAAASAVVEAVKRRGVLLSSDGPDHNVLKIKPPMVLSDADGDLLVRAVDEALTEVEAALPG